MAPVVGLRARHEHTAREQFSDGEGSFSFVSGRPSTENVHLAFAAPDRVTVVGFHRLATGACFRDNGAPGERAQ